MKRYLKRRLSFSDISLGLIVLVALVWVLSRYLGLDFLTRREITETVSGNWIAMYFTAPTFPDDPADHRGGIDAELVNLIGNARESVDVAAYELDLSSVADALLQADRDGVQVRLVTDGSNADEEAVTRLKQADIPVIARPDEGWGIMHNKFVVVDKAWVWTGSWNLTENGTYRNNNHAVLIASRALAEDYTAEFEEMYAGLFGSSSPAETPHPLVNIQGEGFSAQVEVYFAPEDGVGERLVRLLSSAQTDVRFLAFQFTDPRLADVLVDLVGRGVQVQGVMESRSVGNFYSQYSRLRAGGVDVRPDGNPYIMHHKVLVIDGQIVVLGSYNFTQSADEDNDENVLIIHDAEVATAFLAEFDRILRDAQTE